MADLIETGTQFADTPKGWAERWQVELKAAEKNQKNWVEQGQKIVSRFLDDRSESREAVRSETRVNVFTANVQTLRALLYGKDPAVNVKRRFADPNDDIARVAAEMLERLLNTDIEKDSDTYSTALRYALGDRLLPGLGQCRIRYEAEFEEQPFVPAITKPHPEDPTKTFEIAPGYQPEDKKTYECVETDYVFWEDFRWSPARNWNDVRWVAFRIYMTREALIKRFGEDVGKRVPLNSKTTSRGEEDGLKNEPWQRAEVWEIWSKESREVFWWVDGHYEILDRKPDPLGLEGFWPCPEPLVANLTTTKFIPRADFVLAQDVYDEIDSVSTRITLLERAIAVRGVYDKNSDEVKRVLSEAIQNEMIPMDNFSLFKERGGFKGVIDFLPLDMIVGALDMLRQYRSELEALLFQVTGMSDIMRGQATGNGTTATEQAIKAKFASMRVQALQDEFARFASDLQRLKAEVISKLYSPETILQASNSQNMTANDAQIAMEAVGLLKSKFYEYRVEVKPEAISLQDMAAVKQERSEFLMAIATFLQSAAPIIQAAPWATQGLLGMLQWAMAGFRGGSTVEGVLDQMVIQAKQDQMQKQMVPPPPDPQLQIAQVKAGAEQQKAQMDIAGKMVDLKANIAKTQAGMVQAAHKHRLEVAKTAMEGAQAERDHEMTMQQMEAKMRADAAKPEAKP